MANVSANLSLTTNVIGFNYQASGDIVLTFQLIDAGSVVRATKQYTVKADGTGVYDLANAAGAGKVTL